MAFHARLEQLDAATLKTHVEWNGATVGMGDALTLLASAAGFRAGLVTALQSAPFRAYCWETPATSHAASARPQPYKSALA